MIGGDLINASQLFTATNSRIEDHTVPIVSYLPHYCKKDNYNDVVPFGVHLIP